MPNNQSTEPNSVAEGSAGKYATGDWSHFFKGRRTQTECRVVLDLDNEELHNLQIHDKGGWRCASRQEFSDVEDSFVTANEQAFSNPADYGLVRTNALPAWTEI